MGDRDYGGQVSGASGRATETRSLDQGTLIGLLALRAHSPMSWSLFFSPSARLSASNPGDEAPVPGCCEAQSGKQGKLLALRPGLLLLVSSGSFRAVRGPLCRPGPPGPPCARVSLQVGSEMVSREGGGVGGKPGPPLIHTPLLAPPWPALGFGGLL